MIKFRCNQHLITLTKLLFQISQMFFLNIYTLLFVGMPHSTAGTFPETVGKIQVLAGLSQSNQTVGSLGLQSLS
jgi:hypothetical protein